MQELPHHYKVAATAGPVGEVELASSADDLIHSAPPAEYGGPGDLWSPETLLVSAVADCFILTFRAIARASKLEWSTVSCDVTGTLDKVDGVTQFTEFTIKVVLGVDESASESKALRILEKAEAGCLITNSLSGKAHLLAEVVIA
jgi:organic hydroperoxide reductase OsmC/OhrA